MADIYTHAKNKNLDSKYLSRVKLGTEYLPMDVLFSLNSTKIIAQSQVLDGAMVFERVSRKPFDVDFDFVLRGLAQNNDRRYFKNIDFNRPSQKEWIVALDDTKNDNGTTQAIGLQTLFDKIWKLDTVLPVENNALNKIGIFNLIITDIQITTVRGSIDIPIKLKCVEDIYSTKEQGTTLIVK
jgi:hypothetical protein